MEIMLPCAQARRGASVSKAFFQAMSLNPSYAPLLSICFLLSAGLVSLALRGRNARASIARMMKSCGRLFGFEAQDQDKELQLHTLAEAIPQIVWSARPDGTVAYCNQRLLELTGMEAEQSLQSGWQQVLHPDDLSLAVSRWMDALKSGFAYEMEYRVKTRDGGYRWYLVRAIPLHDSAGKIVKWFGTCTDIEDQKHNQQRLETLVQARTDELTLANTRLQEEIIERDYARRELDEQNEKMMRELTERSQRATLLAKMGELLQSCTSKDEVFSAALGFAPKIFPSSRGAVALLNAARNLAEVAGSWQDCLLPVTVFEPAACWALRTGHPHLVVAGDTTARCAHATGVQHTYLCIPILAQGEALGILHFQATNEAPALADSELSFKTTFAGQVGLSVANIRLREALHTQSVKDPLTGLHNRRYLSEMLEREVRRSIRSEQSLGILLLDLDSLQEFQRHLRARWRRCRIARDRILSEQERSRRRRRVPLRWGRIRRYSSHRRSDGFPCPGRKNPRQAARTDRAASRTVARHDYSFHRGGRAAAARHVAGGVNRGRRRRSLPRQTRGKGSRDQRGTTKRNRRSREHDFSRPSHLKKGKRDRGQGSST